MSSTTKLTFADFLQLPADENRYELNEGELFATPAPTPYHNIVRYRIRSRLTSFVEAHHLGMILDESDFRLSANTVRGPDVAFLATQQLAGLDMQRSPVEVAPTLAVEIISPGNSASDMLEKVHQYLAGGSHAVWVFYPTLKLVAVHDAHGIREVSGTLEETNPFSGFTFTASLPEMFNEDGTKQHHRG
jgi:Uma2 family endonuclease